MTRALRAEVWSSGPGTQTDALARGVEPAAIGGHSVGVVDGGPGLPIVGWRTEGGDLLFLVTTWQAFRGQTVLAPNSWTLAALALVAVAVTILGALSLSDRRNLREPGEVST